MAVWWVFQDQSYERSREGGYIWAPLRDKAGRKKSHWESLSNVQPGDLIFSCNKRRIVATSTAKSQAYESPQPHPDDAKDWIGNGRRVDVTYCDLPVPIKVDDLTELFPLLQQPGGPLQIDGRGKLGYLFEVAPEAALKILERLDSTVDVDLLISASQASISGPLNTTVKRTVSARVGQDKFRDNLFARWNGRCALTGVDENSLLIASHIKPWRLSNDFERTDPDNGFLFESRTDKLFDSHLISFTDDGCILISPFLSRKNSEALGLNTAQKLLMPLNRNQLAYLNFHREKLFNEKISKSGTI